MTNKKQRFSNPNIRKEKFSSEVGVGLPIARSSASKGGGRYLPYDSNIAGNVTHNLFPQLIAKMAVDSPTNCAAIQRKSMMIEGRGFDLDALSEGAKAMLEGINDYGETANDILDLAAKDYATFNGFALLVTWGTGGKIVEVEHVNFADVRVGFPNERGRVTEYVVSNNWDRTLTASLERTETYPAFNPKPFKDGVAFEGGEYLLTEDQMNNAQQLIYYFDKMAVASSGMRYYPVPDYVGGLDSVGTEIQIHISNKALLDNGFGGKYFVTVEDNAATDEDKDALYMDLLSSFTGAQHNGGVILNFTPPQGNMPQIDKLEPMDANTYIELLKETKQAIITAHQVPAILLEYNYGGGFNNRAEEMTVAFNMFQQTNIRSKQDSIIRCFKRIMRYMGASDDDCNALGIIPFTVEVDAPQANEGPQGETSLNQQN